LEHLRNVSIAAISALPVAGGPLSVLLDKYLPSYVEQRRSQLLAKLAAGLSELSDRVTPQRLASDEFISVFIKAFRRAMEESLEEKLEAFRAIILNTAISDSSKFDEITLFIRLVSDLTVDQIRILRLLHNDELANEDQGLFQTMQKVWPEVDPDYLMACVAELLRYNLATSNARGRDVNANSLKTHAITGLGRRFIEYISLPRAKISEPATNSQSSLKNESENLKA
jgi:hypothetical protein